MSGAALLGLCGLGLGIGLLLLAAGRRPQGSPPLRLFPSSRGARARRGHTRRWAMAAAAAGVTATAFTGWLVAAPLTAVAVWHLPRLLGTTTNAERTTEKIDAVASWAEMLRDTLAAGAGLEQTITATAATAPDPIRPHIRALADALARSDRLATALRRTADDLADPTADLVLGALILSSRHQARQLAPRLGALAQAARAQTEMRRRVAAAQSRVRTTVRIITGSTLAFIAGLVLFNREFLRPYDAVTGQAMLLVVGGIFAVALAWLARLARITEPARFLTAQETE